MSAEIRFDVANGVASVTLDRPARRNALSIAMSETLFDLWERIDADDAIHAAIVTAADCGVFCAGMDLTEAAAVRTDRGIDILDALRDPFHERMRKVRKPIVAALNGHFTAAGMVLAANADLRVGLAGTRAGITEARVGRGTPWAVPMLWMMPQALLLELVLTAEMIPVERLHAVGFVNYVEPTADAVRERARTLATAIARNAPLSVRAGKEGLRLGAALGAEAGFTASKNVHREVYASDDAREGPRAFAERRPPVWKGR
ncbi:MAG: enoyl-CoA hydratase/isomerase family protein [Burkholderiales bacterium]|nr:enoyl-CoA hydratase/isomerase family protein [Burkholderiales bacterium]